MSWRSSSSYFSRRPRYQSEHDSEHSATIIRTERVKGMNHGAKDFHAERRGQGKMTETRRCPKCKAFKPLAQYGSNAAREDGLQFYCLECTRFYFREYKTKNRHKIKAAASEWARNHPESGREKARLYRKRHEQKIRARTKALYAENKDQIKALLRNYKYKREFGITLSERSGMAAEQDGRCLICGTHEGDLTERLSVDHDHATKQVRGLLCRNCNHGIGNFHDDPDLLRAAAIYLERARKPKEEIA